MTIFQISALFNKRFYLASGFLLMHRVLKAWRSCVSFHHACLSTSPTSDPPIYSIQPDPPLVITLPPPPHPHCSPSFLLSVRCREKEKFWRMLSVSVRLAGRRGKAPWGWGPGLGGGGGWKLSDGPRGQEMTSRITGEPSANLFPFRSKKRREKPPRPPGRKDIFPHSTVEIWSRI